MHMLMILPYSKKMLIFSKPICQEQKLWLRDKCLHNEEFLNKRCDVFNRNRNNVSHVNNILTKCIFSFHFDIASIVCSGATPNVQAYLYTCICQNILTHGLVCTISTTFKCGVLKHYKVT